MGAYSYSLKMFVFEKVRSKRFPWAWGLLHLCHALPLGAGLPLGRLASQAGGLHSHYYVYAVLVLAARSPLPRPAPPASS